MTDVERNAILGNVQRQYVGARYVPKFFQGPDGTPTWVGNVPYEALTIVTYLGNSYTSKIPVPAGIGNPSQNPTYWALTGNFNAQVEEIRKSLNDLIEEFNQFSDSTNNMLLKLKKNNKNRKIILIGDSYAEQTNSIFNDVINYPGFDRNNIFNLAETSAGFISVGIRGNTFFDLLNNSLGKFKTEDVTDILVAGGYNDRTESWTTLGGAINRWIREAISLYPNATVYGALCAGNYTDYNVRLLIMNNLLPAWSFNFSQLGVFLPESFNTFLAKNDFSGGGLYHPSQIGATKIGCTLVSGLLGESAQYKQGLTNFFGPAVEGVTISGSGSIYRNTYNLLLNSNNTSTITFSSTQVIKNFQAIKICEKPDSLFDGANIKIAVGINIKDKKYNGFILITDAIYIELFDTTIASDITGVANIYLLPFSATLPPMII